MSDLFHSFQSMYSHWREMSALSLQQACQGHLYHRFSDTLAVLQLSISLGRDEGTCLCVEFGCNCLENRKFWYYSL
ncbi:hypothetical protein J4Q44_G00333910, partial [Coregonus suidteri]